MRLTFLEVEPNGVGSVVSSWGPCRRWVVGAVLATAAVGCGGSAEYAQSAPRDTYSRGGMSEGMAVTASDDAEIVEIDTAATPTEPFDGDKKGEAPMPAPIQAKAPAEVPKPSPPPGNPTGAVASESARKQPILIYRAEFSLSVYEVEKSLDAVEALTKEQGGYLSKRDDRGITVRVPAQKFQDLVAAIEKVGDVLHRDVSSEDVTAEYRDLEVQLQNHIALRARFEKLLEKAHKVEEALQIERELGRITGEIERVKGRLKLLTDLASYSTITVRFEPRSTQQVQQGPFVLPLPWLNQVGLRRLMSL